jgi:hypothetical protein
MRTLDFSCRRFDDVRRIAAELYPKAANYALLGDTAGTRAAVARIEGIARVLRDELHRAHALVQDSPDLRSAHEERARGLNALMMSALSAGLVWPDGPRVSAERWLLGDGVIASSSVSASHTHPPPWTPEYSSLTSGTGWYRNRNDVPCIDWIQMDAGSCKVFRGVRTRGRGDGHQQWVSRFRLSFSTDGLSWFSDEAFTGNTNTADIVEHIFPAGVLARYVRLYPMEWTVHACLRWDLLVLS